MYLFKILRLCAPDKNILAASGVLPTDSILQVFKDTNVWHNIILFSRKQESWILLIWLKE